MPVRCRQHQAIGLSEQDHSMLRIGIVGSDNSHALAYGSLLNVEGAAGDSARAVAIWGQEPARTEEVATRAEIPAIVATPEEMLGQVDAVFVEDRHGGLHAEHALPFLNAGLPVFVDKPLAISLEDCGRLIAAADASGSFLTSFSSLRTATSTVEIASRLPSIGSVRAAQFAGPCDFESMYGGLYFYATHTVEVALRLVGEDVRTVRAIRNGNQAVATLTWESGATAAISYIGDAQYHFHATLFGTDGMTSGEVLANHDGYRTSLGVVLDGITSGVRSLTDEQLVRPVAIARAMEESIASDGREVEIQPLIATALA
jgi:predicted dehydrogenase